jgi:Leucine-rich repeat (LRR) protein
MHPISSPAYFQLKTLKLTHTQINNIEALSFFNAPQLRTVDLSYNQIVSVKSFNKLYLPQLKQFKILNNEISEIDLSRFHIEHKNLIIGFSLSSHFKIIVQDLKFWLKFESNHFKIDDIKNLIEEFSARRSYGREKVIVQKKTVKAIINKLRYRE